MADEVDIANDQLNNELSRMISKIRKSAPEGKGAKTCLECGEQIPKERQQHGFKFCVACAETRERKESLFVES